VQNTGEHRGADQRAGDDRKRPRRSRRAFGTVERLPSGRFRARVIGPDGRYVSAPATFPNRTDAARWVHVQHVDMVRGTWQAPVKPSASPSVAAYVAQQMTQHPGDVNNFTHAETARTAAGIEADHRSQNFAPSVVLTQIPRTQQDGTVFQPVGPTVR
jgi:hypothetical protein